MTELERQVRRIQEVFREEPLDPELLPHLVDIPNLGQALKHPLVYQVPFFPHLAGIANDQFRAKRERADRARREGDWDLYIMLHERPYRLNALFEIAPLLRGREYWETVSYVWTDSENVWQNKQAWRMLLAAQRRGRVYLTPEDDRDTLRRLRRRRVVRVYRGAGKRNLRGFSWTLDVDRATWFAHRLKEPGNRTYTMQVPGDKIIAYIDSRSEQETLIHPEYRGSVELVA